MAQQDTQKTSLREVLAAQQAEAADVPILPLTPLPLIRPNSGLYLYTASIITPLPVPTPIPIPIPIPGPGPGAAGYDEELAEAGVATPILPLLHSEELRLDVDSYYPQMRASGRIYGFKIAEANWIADVKQIAPNTYEGPIWYKEGNTGLIPYTKVSIQVTRTLFAPQTAKATFSGGGGSKVRVFKYKSRYFHPVNFEFDVAEGVTALTSYNTGSHPNRPASLPVENLTITNVFRRMGFDVTISGGANVIPIVSAGADAKWSDTEMHDAMQVHWSKFANAPQWALWTLFASLHEMGASLGGIMFDDIGPNHRQGTSLFVDSFIKNPPAGDPAPAAWINRMIFWTACHEMGHAFNLAHSWQKSLGTQWIPLANEPLARSFMNYPYNVPGGQSAFFADFEFRFSNGELLFVRHAPFRFVQMGNADWFDHHGFQQASVSPEPQLALGLECTRKTDRFEFLEPIVLHLRLKNISDQPQLVGEKVLSSPENMTVIIKKRGKPARELGSFAQRCWHEKRVVLAPKQEISDSLFLSAGRNGWDLAEPGIYTIQVALHLGEEDVVSEPLTVRVGPPRGYDEELLAQDFFSEDVGRALAFDGSTVLKSANNTLRELTDRLSKSRASIHARVALASPCASSYKHVEVDDKGAHTLRVSKADHAEARKLLSPLVEESDNAIGTLGQIDYDYYTARFKSVLAEAAAKKAGR